MKESSDSDNDNPIAILVTDIVEALTTLLDLSFTTVHTYNNGILWQSR
jgi:hypothetical protein